MALLYKLLLGAGIVYLWLATRRGLRAGIQALEAYRKSHNRSVFEAQIEELINWAEVRLTNLDGPAKMQWVLRELRKLGVDVAGVEQYVELIYQRMASYGPTA